MEDSNGLCGPSRDLALRITRLFCEGKLDLSRRPRAPACGWEALPEVCAAKRLRALGADDRTVRLFCTFVMAMDRARDSYRLWESGVKLFKQAPWAFEPGEVVLRPFDELAGILCRFGVSQRHRPDSRAWRRIAESLHAPETAPAVRRAVFDGEGDVVVLEDEVTHAFHNRTACFPLLRGPKIASVWIRTLAYPGRAAIRRLEQLPMGVDVQVRKVTEYLGVTDTRGKPLGQAVRDTIQQAWARLLAVGDAEGPEPLRGTPAALDAALWFYAKWGCTRCEKVGEKLPIVELCTLCCLGERSPS